MRRTMKMVESADLVIELRDLTDKTVALTEEMSAIDPTGGLDKI